MISSEKTKAKEGLIDKVELIYSSLYFLVGLMLQKIFGAGGIFTIIMTFSMIVYMILLIIYAKDHVYWDSKRLLTVLSIFYKNFAYLTVIFVICNYPFKDIFMGITLGLIILYIILSYFNGKRYGQMLNAYLYLTLVSISLAIFY